LKITRGGVAKSILSGGLKQLWCQFWVTASMMATTSPTYACWAAATLPVNW
jgi:hypothetical protein